MWLLQSKGAEKANFSYRHAEFEQLKWKKKKKKTRNDQACSLFTFSSLFSGKGKKNSFLCFPFHHNKFLQG